jgi:putative FmdB family regulatory protein
MPWYEYVCEGCGGKFEEISSASTSADQRGCCPRCGTNEKSRRLISRFAVGGQGDLRESTMHGCHDHSHEEGHES